MKALILAAGVGSRLRPITNSKPKTLVEVNSKPMLGKIIDNLVANDIHEIIICTGYQSEKIRNYCQQTYPNQSISFVENEEFESTNNMYSLYLAREHLRGDLLVMNADLFFDEEVITNLIGASGTAFAVDVGRYMEESMKVSTKDNVITNISKTIPPETAYGCSIDVYRFSDQDTKILATEMVQIIESENDRNQWTEVLLDRLCSSGRITPKVCPINKARWFEIDNFDDLAAAEILFNSKLSDLSSKKIFFIDRDGTLTLGNSKITGAENFINYLNNHNKTYYVLTNNSCHTPAVHYEILSQAGLPLSPDNILVSTQAAVAYLKQNQFTRIHALANANVQSWLSSQGLDLVDQSPDALLLTYDDSVTYDKLVQFVRFVQQGIPYFATHTDVVCPTAEGPIPDIGTLIKTIEMTTGKLPIKTFGKPSTDIITPILNDLGMSLSDAVIIGDRLYTDIQMAENNALTSVLVLTGETTRADYESSENQVRADIIVPNLDSLTDVLSR